KGAATPSTSLRRRGSAANGLEAAGASEVPAHQDADVEGVHTVVVVEGVVVLVTVVHEGEAPTELAPEHQTSPDQPLCSGAKPQVEADVGVVLVAGEAEGHAFPVPVHEGDAGGDEAV